MKKRAMHSDKARHVRQQGHDDAQEFAKLIGTEYANDPQGKKDIVDKNGDAHSVKSGEKKWQIFLYRSSRIKEDSGFVTMNGVGQAIIDCLDVFPNTYDEYIANKPKYKNLLRPAMIRLKELLDFPARKKAFLQKSLFNGTEVLYFTIMDNKGVFHIFFRDDVITVLTDNLSVENSRARRKLETSEQKVVFKQNTTIGEIEIRRDGGSHYKEVKFWLFKEKTLKLLQDNIKQHELWGNKITVYGKALGKFKRNHYQLLLAQ